MIDLKVGQVWECNEPQWYSFGRYFTIVETDGIHGQGSYENSDRFPCDREAINANFTLMEALVPAEQEKILVDPPKKAKSEGDRMMDFFAGKKEW